MQRIILLVVLFTLAASGAAAQGKFEITEKQHLPAAPAGYVGDYAKVLDERTERQLETKLAGLSKRTRIEFLVVIIQTTGGEDISAYSLAAARKWQRGSRPRERGGILLMIAVKDRQWRVQITTSLERDLPEAVLKEKGDRMTVSFSRGNMGEGVNLFVDEVIAHLNERRAFKASAP